MVVSSVWGQRTEWFLSTLCQVINFESTLGFFLEQRIQHHYLQVQPPPPPLPARDRALPIVLSGVVDCKLHFRETRRSERVSLIRETPCKQTAQRSS